MVCDRRFWKNVDENQTWVLSQPKWFIFARSLGLLLIEWQLTKLEGKASIRPRLFRSRLSIGGELHFATQTDDAILFN